MQDTNLGSREHQSDTRHPPTAASSAQGRAWGWPATFWAMVMALAALYIAAEASRYLWLPATQYAFDGQRGTYAAHSAVILTHIAAGIVALLAGAAQFVPQLKRFRRWHRFVGALYCASVACAGVAGLRASGFAFGGTSNTAAFFLMSLAWLGTTAMALACIWRGRVRDHQLWMKRSYAIALGAVTLRIELGLLIVVGGLSFADTYRIVPWTSWVLNLMVLEWCPLFQRFSVSTRAATR